jgi:hypothetical protein
VKRLSVEHRLLGAFVTGALLLASDLVIASVGGPSDRSLCRTGSLAGRGQSRQPTSG